jgi:hypothetical protein
MVAYQGFELKKELVACRQSFGFSYMFLKSLEGSFTDLADRKVDQQLI